MTKNTRDEAYRWVAHTKEKKMYRNLASMRNSLIFSKYEKKEPPLAKFEDKLKIYADYREKGSGVIKTLAERGVIIHQEMLTYADYVVSSKCGIEIKTTSDFVNSIVDGRLLFQIKNLKQNFEKPLVIIEGSEDLYSVRNVHQNAILGMLATITISYGVPIVQTKNFKETSDLIYIIAKREQDGVQKDFSPHSDKKLLTMKEQQEYVVSSFPGIGIGIARPLLVKFKTIKKIVNADESELRDSEKIGPVKANQLKNLFDSEYK